MGLQLYWLWRRRKDYKDASRFKFWSQHVPLASFVYFGEAAEIICIRTVESLIADRLQGKGGSIVLIVRNELFGSVVERLRHYLADENAALELQNPDFSRQLREHATALCQDVPDLTPLLVLIYLGLPILALHQSMLICEYLYTVCVYRQQSGQEFDLVTGNRD